MSTNSSLGSQINSDAPIIRSPSSLRLFVLATSASCFCQGARDRRIIELGQQAYRRTEFLLKRDVFGPASVDVEEQSVVLGHLL
jgi:hypothetical protein